MREMNYSYLRAIGTMIGGIVGVGIFGIPYAFSQSGLALGILTLLVVGALLTALQLMFADVCIQSGGSHRLAGYIRTYLGKRWGVVALIISTLTVWGAMVAYMIIGGGFWHELFAPSIGGSPALYAILIAFAAGALMYRGIGFASRMEVIVVSVLLFLFLFLALSSVPFIDTKNLLTVDFSKAFVPYGVILFSMAGLSLVPEMYTVLGKKHAKKLLPRAILIAMLTIGLLNLLFGITVLGVTGEGTTQNAFLGLVPILGDGVRIAGAILGSIVILSIYTVLGVTVQDMMHYDFGMKKLSAFALVAGVPILLYLLGVREFINVISFVGSILGGALGLLLVFTFEGMRRSPVCEGKRICFDVPVWVSVVIGSVFALGILLEIGTRVL